MSPLRLLQGTLGEEDSAPGKAMSEQELLRRADEIQRRGPHGSGHEMMLSQQGAPAMVQAHP